jgi:hypothetical protein
MVEMKFIVPYERNPQFIGKQRKEFLEIMNEKLSIEVPQEFNHRIALHGLGGIGKTQCALEYAYLNKDKYERIYWISAVDQASMLSGYQKIAKSAGVHHSQLTRPIEVAETAKAWLNQQSNWLVVIDNLDDHKVANGLLPENGIGKHTIITTRNPNTSGIPAEPLAVPLLDEDDSVELLLTLSKFRTPTSEQLQDARKIVEQLGQLPLAIKQAAAYVNTVTGDLGAFLHQYRQNRADVHNWPTDNPQYPYNVATTWSMSFEFLRNCHPPAARLLQIFSFANPDGIQLEFLLAGAIALDDSLRQVMSSETAMAKVLLELEKFSLIRWDRTHKLISIHRLVQLVVGDAMTNEERNSAVDGFIGLCADAFPVEVTNESRPICRKYQSQVVEPLLRLGVLKSVDLCDAKGNVGRFLLDDASTATVKNSFGKLMRSQ